MKLLLLFSLLAVPALADQVKIEWVKVKGISQYELEVKRGKKIVYQNRFPGNVTAWEGRLPFGRYDYRLRLISKKKKGPWSESTPFYVMPDPPKLVSPTSDSTVLLGSSGEATFEWTATPGIEKYALELKGQNNFVRRKVIKGTKGNLGPLIAGEFTWTVKPVLNQTQVIDIKSSDEWKVRLDFEKGAERNVASEGEISEAITNPPRVANVSAGLLVGIDYFLPSLQGSYAFGEGWAAGFFLAYANLKSDDVMSRIVGSLATIDYYFSKRAYQGFFGEAALGAYFFSAKNATTEEGMRGAFSALAGGGWHWRPKNGNFNVRLTVGGQYVASSRLALVETSLKGVVPFGLLSFGWAF